MNIQDTDQEKIKSAAIRASDGTVYVKDPPARHHDIIYVMSDKHGLGAKDTWDQGFMTTKGRFVDRYEAKAIALSQQQVLDFLRLRDRLFTEDLW